MPGVVLRCLSLCCSWWRWCSGRRRARPPARSPHASLKARSGRSRSPPVPSGPSGALHIGGSWCTEGVRSPARSCSHPRAPQPVPSRPSAALRTCGPGRWRVLGALSRSPAALLSLAVTHVKPSSPLLACALSPVKPTTPLQARYTHFWCYFIAQRRRGFHTGVLRFPHWC